MPTVIYRNKKGKRVDSVTGILGVLNKPALIYWGYTQGLENFTRITESVARLCGEPCDRVDTLRDNILSELRQFQIGGLYDKRDKAATAGTLGHLYVENHLKGLDEPSLTDFWAEHESTPKKDRESIEKKGQGCYLAFMEWERTHKFKLIQSELSLVSEKFQYGGTFDIGGVLGDMAMVDIKTGKGIYPASMVPQITAYGKLWNEHHPDNIMVGYHIICLKEDGGFEHKYWADVEWAWDIFLGCKKIKDTLNAGGLKL